MTWIWIAAGAVLAFAAWMLYRRFGSDRIAQLNERRRASARLVSPGEYVDGNRHLPVALAVTQSTFFYENADMEGSLDLDFVREIEYDSGLATGAKIHKGKVLRLRSDSGTFEFVLPEDVASRWTTILPPHGQQASPGANPPQAAVVR